MPKVVCLWPGLPQLWLRGGWSGLALAVAFTLLLDVVLAASLVWTEWLGADLLLAGWGAIGLLWGASTWVSWQTFVSPQMAKAEIPRPDVPDLFAQAQGHYLQGNWFEAERLLNDQLARDVKDVDARLLLATLWRHLGRWDEAERQLASLEKWEKAVKWRLEIDRERRLIARRREDQAEEEQVAETAAP